MHQEPTPTELMGAIVELHEAVSRGFAQVDVRFAQVQGEISGIHTRLTSVEGEISGIHTRLTSVEGEMRGIHHWMARTDQRLSAT